MRGLDTNILLRHLLLDDPHQVAVVKNLFDEGTERNERYHVSSIVLCELVWVLLRLPAGTRQDQLDPRIDLLG